VQEDFAQEPQEDCPAKGFSTPAMPKRESFFTTFSVPHAGHPTDWEPYTSFSKSFPHWEHVYS
jgi:hypothetical protein